jgi:hypothetical protein
LREASFEKQTLKEQTFQAFATRNNFIAPPATLLHGCSGALN